MARRKMHLPAQFSTLLGMGLVAICLSGCANRDPLSMIPMGLRATLQSEDRAAQPKRPVSITTMLAKARGDAGGSEEGGAPPSGSVAAIAARPAAVPSPNEASEPPPVAETILRFAPASPKINSIEALKLTLAANRLVDQPGPLRIVMGPGEGGLSPAQTMALVMQRGAAVKALLPKALIARAEVHYSPALAPDTAVLRPRTADSDTQ